MIISPDKIILFIVLVFFASFDVYILMAHKFTICLKNVFTDRAPDDVISRDPLGDPIFL